MQESVLSSRRSPPSAEDEGGDDAPRGRNHTSLLAATICKHVASGGGVLVLVLLLFGSILAVTFFSRSGSSVFVPPCEVLPVTNRTGRVGGLASDFGSLGVPWCRSKRGRTVEWTTKDLLKALEEFVSIYETRPIKNNKYGMRFDHSFGLWFMARWLKPDLMIESGAFRGHSTWVLRQAMPDARIITLSPQHPEKFLKKGPVYVDRNCTYFTGKDFVDFGTMDWGTVMQNHGISDLSQVLVLFDDHQNELKRLKQALKAGFRHLIFDDNFDTGTGDHYSLRHM